MGLTGGASDADSCCQSFVLSTNLTFSFRFPQPFRFPEERRRPEVGGGPVWSVTTSIPHGYICQSLLPPVWCCLDLCGCIGRRPIQCARPRVGFPLRWQLCVWYCSRLPVRLSPLYLKSVISESLKRLGQFREDKWWIGRTAPSPTTHRCRVPPRTRYTTGGPDRASFYRAGRSREPLYYSHQNKL